jgi:hypothetical protein
MSRETGRVLTLLPSRGCVSWRASLERCLEVEAARGTYAKADALLTTMTAGELTSSYR